MSTSPCAHSPSDNVALSSRGSTLLGMDIYRSPGTGVDSDFSVLDLLLFLPLRATGCETKALGAGRCCLGRCLCSLDPCARAGDTLTIYQLISLVQWAIIYTALDRGAGRSTSNVQPDALGTSEKVQCPTARCIRSHIDIASLACFRVHIVDAAVARSHKV